MEIFRHALLLICTVSLLGLMGCGDSDGSNGASDTTSPPADTDTFDASDADGTTDADASAPDSTGDADIASDGSDTADDEDSFTPDTNAPDGAETSGDGESQIDVDSGPTCDETADCDSDGLNDCEEKELQTEPCDSDSDNDGLLDLQEIQKDTDPNNADTDRDGATDEQELQYNLDPRKPSTFGDGVQDGDRWRINACEDPSAEPVNYFRNETGNWLLALPPAFDNYTDLELSGTEQDSLKAAAVYDDPASEVAGALVSTEPSNDITEPTPVIDQHRSTVKSLATIEQDFNTGVFLTHDDRPAASGRYLVQMPEALSVRALRDKLSSNLVGVETENISGLPDSAGAKHKSFRIFVSVVLRCQASPQDPKKCLAQQGKQAITSVAIAPADKYNARDQIKFRMDDLTNTTNIAEAFDKHALRCRPFQPVNRPQTDFYWVLDQSGSMDDDYDRVTNVANQFYGRLKNSALDFRLGVTTMYEEDQGRIHSSTGWTTKLDPFLSDIEWVKGRCSSASSLGCAGDEFGLKSAKQGLNYMLSSRANQNVGIRPDANVITIFMSDEEAQTIQNEGLNSSQFSNFKSFFPNHTTAFSIVGNGEDCGSSDGEAYRQVALATGGSHASLCAENINETINDIIIAAAGFASNYELPGTPISSTLRVFVNGNWVPRSRDNGFDYFAQTNSISFFGDVLPKPPPESGNEPGDFIAVSYETMLDITKRRPNEQEDEGSGDSSNSDESGDGN